MAKHGLDALKKAWAKAKTDAKEFSNPHFNDGHYLTKISAVKVGESKKGSAQLVIDFTFLEGEYTGKSKRTWWNLDPDNSTGLAITVGMLIRMGLPDVEPETLEQDVQQLLGKIVRIQIVTTTAKDGVTEYQNVRVEKIMGVDPETADAAPKAVEEPEPEAEEELEADADKEEEAPVKKSKAKGSEEPEESEDEEEEEEAAEEVAEEDEEEGVDISIGMKVAFTKKDGSELNGTVEEIDEENGKVVVKAKVNGVFKKFRVDVDRLSAL